MHILLFLLLSLAAAVISGLSIVGFVLGAIFGLGRGSSSWTKQARGEQNDQQQGCPSCSQNTDGRVDNEGEIFAENSPRARHKRAFIQDDGEYVDLEEMK